MNTSEAALRTNPLIVPPDLLLRFGYTPNGAIEFDSVAETLSFYQGGTQRVDISSFGLAVRDTNGLVVGHTAQITVGGTVSEFQVLGNGAGASDHDMVLAAFRADAFAGSFRFLKSRTATVGGNATVGNYAAGDDMGLIRWNVDDGTDYASEAATIVVEADSNFALNDTPGRMIFKTTPAGAASPIEALRVDSSQNVQMRNESYLWIGPDSAATAFVDAQTAVGIVINQEANDNQAITLKSSDVAHGFTAITETDTYFFIKKQAHGTGGVNLQAMGEDAAVAVNLALTSHGGTASTTKTIAGQGLINVYVAEHNGANAQANITADGNVFSIQARVGGGNVTRFLIDEDGDMYSVTAGQTFDDWDDVALIETYDAVRSGTLKADIKAEFGRVLSMNEQTLIEAGVLGAPMSEGGLTNQSQLSRILTGGVRQLNEKHLSLVERVNSLAIELTEAKQKLAALTA